MGGETVFQPGGPGVSSSDPPWRLAWVLVHSSWDSEVVTVNGVLREAAAAGPFLALQLVAFPLSSVAALLLTFCHNPRTHVLLGGPLGAFSPAAVLFYSSKWTSPS